MYNIAPENRVIPVKNANYIGQTYQYTSINPSTSNRSNATGSGVFSMTNYGIAMRTGKWAIEPGVEGDDFPTLLSNYDFGESTCYSGAGTSVTDGTFSGRLATLMNSPTYGTSNGGIMNFSTNQYMTVGSDANLAFGLSDFTLEFWVYITSFGTITAFANSSTNLTSAGNTIWWFGYYLGALTLGQHNTSNRSSFTVSLNSGQWYHLGVSRISGQCWFFVDGSYGLESGTTNPRIFQSTSWGQIGLAFGMVTTPYYLNGSIAAARIYKNKYLTDAELRTNYYVNRGRFV